MHLRFDAYSPLLIYPDSDSDKKIHQGWGGDEPGTELNAEVQGADDAAQAADSGADWGIAPDASAPAAEATPAADGEAPAGDKPERKGRFEEEEEDNTLTLEQYRQQQQSKSDIIPARLEGRKVEDTDIKGTVLGKKEEEAESYFVAHALACV
jgi:plasminogen activator inhibitor 1 RNA-binding protein